MFVQIIYQSLSDFMRNEDIEQKYKTCEEEKSSLVNAEIDVMAYNIKLLK